MRRNAILPTTRSRVLSTESHSFRLPAEPFQCFRAVIINTISSLITSALTGPTGSSSRTSPGLAATACRFLKSNCWVLSVTCRRMLRSLGDPIVGSSNNTPGSEGVANAIDNQPTKYLNFDRLNTGFTVSPRAGLTLVSGLTLTRRMMSPTATLLTTRWKVPGTAAISSPFPVARFPPLHEPVSQGHRSF